LYLLFKNIPLILKIFMEDISSGIDHPSKFNEFLRVKNETISELLQERTRLEKALEENAHQLAELGHSVTGSKGPTAKSVRLPDHEIKATLADLLKGDGLSIPKITAHLNIARSRFAAFVKRNPSFLKVEGRGRNTLYKLA
jgi:hypothetical protein